MEIKQAKKRVEALKGYYIHLTMYLTVIGFLAIIDYFDGGGWWVIWPLVGWGIAIIMHSVALFFDITFLSQEWEEQKINELTHKSK